MIEIRENCKAVRDKVAQAALRAGRSPEDVTVIAVTKTRSPQEIDAVIDSGFDQLGENRIQETNQKRGRVSGNARWHLVGHLQTNKAKLAVSLFDVVQSVDSLRVATALNNHAGDAGKELDVLVQINTAGASQQSGMPPDETEEAIGQILSMSNLRLRGLMTIGAHEAEEATVRSCFARLREQREHLLSTFARADLKLQYLSMGMSGDFELAIAEGANMVRLGTTIFGPRS